MRERIIRAMTRIVPILAALIIGADILLNSFVGDQATYTYVIRAAFYAHPVSYIIGAGAIGALWAHLCWTPGGEIEAIKHDLFTMGAETFMVDQSHDGLHKVTVIMPSDSPDDWLISGKCTSDRLAWREVWTQGYQKVLLKAKK